MLWRRMGGHSTQSWFDEAKRRSAEKEMCFEGQECFLSCQLVHPALAHSAYDPWFLSLIILRTEKEWRKNFRFMLSLFENKKLKNGTRERERKREFKHFIIRFDLCMRSFPPSCTQNRKSLTLFQSLEQIAYICFRSRLPVSASANPISFEIHPTQIFRKNIINLPKKQRNNRDNSI